jgi:hypothetical protein
MWAFVEIPLVAGLKYDPKFTVKYPMKPPAQGYNYSETVHLDVISFQSDWDLNAIPSGSIQVAVGRRCDNPDIVSAIHSLVDNMKLMLRCQVWMHAEERSNDYRDGLALDEWPAEPFVCFDGYVGGTGFRQSRSASGNEAGFRLDLLHWLADLNFSSSLSRTSHQLNPAQYSFPAAFSSGTGILPKFVSSTMAAHHFLTSKVSTDFWGVSLMPWMKELCRSDRFNAVEVPLVAADPIRGQNYEALRALNRIEPFNITHDPAAGAIPAYTFGVPLQMSLGTLSADAAARSLASSVSRETVDSMASNTLWEKLVSQYGPNYLFSLVPMVDRALIVPFIPGLRTWWKTILAEEHDAVDLSAKLPRALRGVGLFTGRGSSTGAVATRPGTTPVADAIVHKIGGYYENDEQRGGQIILKRGPDWLTNVAVPYLYGSASAAPSAVKSTATSPGVGAPSAASTPAELQIAAAPLWQRYAQALYNVEVLKGRGGTIRSRLRFDIAPGSSVQVITAKERFVSAKLKSPSTEVCYGSVIRVSIVANSESMQAGTIFHVGYNRSANENISPSFSTYRHPLWSNVWEGAPLIGNHAEFLRPESGGRLLGTDDPEVLRGEMPFGTILPRTSRPA